MNVFSDREARCDRSAFIAAGFPIALVGDAISSLAMLLFGFDSALAGLASRFRDRLLGLAGKRFTLLVAHGVAPCWEIAYSCLLVEDAPEGINPCCTGEFIVAMTGQ
jgi:hypothetical protein